jgi:hypothetical protein
LAFLTGPDLDVCRSALNALLTPVKLLAHLGGKPSRGIWVGCPLVAVYLICAGHKDLKIRELYGHKIPPLGA